MSDPVFDFFFKKFLEVKNVLLFYRIIYVPQWTRF